MKPFLAFLLLVSYTCADSLNETTAYGYLRRHGIPAAERIRKAEKNMVSTMIVGGSPVLNEDFAYVAGLLITMTDGMALCGASLISDNTLLTAAHCWNDGVDQAQFYTVVLGSLFLFYGGTRINTSDVTTHPKWNPSTVRYDIAVIKLPSPVTLSSTINPVALPFGVTPSEHYTGYRAIAVGYGLTSDDGRVTSNQYLSYVHLVVISNIECLLTFPTILRKTNICTSGLSGAGPCSGDSGGPLTVVDKNNKTVLVGCVSFGSSMGCQSRLPTAYTRITEVEDFITAHL